MSIRTASTCIVAGALLALQITPAVAQRSNSQGGQHGSDFGVSLRAGTLGGGIELSKLLVSHVGIRVGANYFSVNRDSLTSKNVSYDAHLKLQSFSGLLDLYPSPRGSFHLSAGVISDPLKITGSGKSQGGTFDINNHTYTATQVGTLTAEAKFASALPYVGLGFGTAASKHGGVSFVFDLGAAIGKPTVSLTSSNATAGSQLQNDLNAQIATTQTSADKLKAYPVLALGLMLKF
ncbi:MAG TPA: hypothetical protein VN719_15570 [Gemmatimonadales bacterium]|nr:hypothetical protein [Gemmatimonadales bacterium]